MDIFGPKPIEHKNQAGFATPNLPLYNNYSTLKDKLTNGNLNLINHLSNTQSSQLSMKKLVQNSSLNNDQQLLNQKQPTNGDYNQTTNGNNNLFNYDPSKVKIENDSNESTRSDQRLNNSNYTNNLNGFNFAELNFKMTNPQLKEHSNSIQNNLNTLGINLNNLSNFNRLNGINGFSGIPGMVNNLGSLNGLNEFNNLNNLSNLNNFNSMQNINSLNNIKQAVVAQNGKRGSGRRPSNLREEKLTAEEEERRRVRRERNKEAAARCRRRRVEHTSTLETETRKLGDEKRSLESQIADLNKESARLIFLLKNHDCKIVTNN